MRAFDRNSSIPFFLFIVTCFVILYLVLGSLLAKYLFRTPGYYRYDEQKFIEQKINDLKVKEQFWLNKIKAAEEDSIVLTINLQDSILTLDLLGIELRSCRIYHYRMNRTLAEQKQNGKLLSLLTYSMQLKEERATIPKEPLIIRQIEIGKPVLEDFSFLYRPFDSTEVILDFTFNRDLHIRFEEKRYNWQEQDVTSLLPFNKHYLALHTYWLELQLAANDLRAIYRALPAKAKLVLCL
jgi:hypothetical protein